MSAFGQSVGPTTGRKSDKILQMSLVDTLRLAWADPELRQRIIFVLQMFAVFVLGSHISVPIPGVSPAELVEKLKGLPFFQLLDTFGGGSIRRVSIFALGLNPYITASIIMQIVTTSIPAWKKELQEGGEYGRNKQNKRTKILMVILCVAQGWGLLQMMGQGLGPGILTPMTIATTVLFWTAGSFFVLWLGEQISAKGIGNGVSLMIFAGIIASLPALFGQLFQSVFDRIVQWWQVAALLIIFLATTYFIVFFTTAQRRIPIQHMRRMVGTRMMSGGGTNYLPLSVNMAGVIPIIFAVSLVYMPLQFSMMFPPESWMHRTLATIGEIMNPGAPFPKGLIGCALYALLIGFFTYFYTAIQYNVEDISNNLKRGGSFIPGVRPGKQTMDFLNQVISRITIVGAVFLAIVALTQYLAPALTGIQGNVFSIIGGTSLLIMVSVALETMRQIEANLMMKQYGG
ncbi:MAG: preprotein translocase subunit SecY [Fimbriimonadaceae bacterium]